MIKKILALMTLVVGLSVNACWFTAVNYDKCYIARINTTVVYDDSATWENVQNASRTYQVVGTGDYTILTNNYGYQLSIDEGGSTYRGLQDSNRIMTSYLTGIGGTSVVWEIFDRTIPAPTVGVRAIVPVASGGSTLYPPYHGWTILDLGFNTTGTVDITGYIGDAVSPAGTQDLPCQVWIKIAPRTAETGFDAPAPISTAMLQYKKLPSGTWTTFKTLTTINWTMDFNKPVQLFGPNIFDPPTATTGDEYLVRLYFTDGIYENADLGTNAPEGGDTAWRNQWVTKITISGKRRPQ